jgi:hypothetical protein
MGVGWVLALAVAGTMLCAPGARSQEAAAGGELFRHEVTITPAASEAPKPQKKRKLAAKAKRETKKGTSTAASGFRKFTKDIANSFATFFDSDGRRAKSANAARRATSSATMRQATGESSPQNAPQAAFQDFRPPETALRQPGSSPQLEAMAPAADIKEHPRCKKAKEAVGKYAFVDVEALSCEGEVYRFSAMREGNRFQVRIKAASGELLGVEKLAPAASAAIPSSSQPQAPP